jgi:CheY-like chemotaxis protein
MQVISCQDGDEAYQEVESGDTWPDFVFLDFQLNTGDNGDVVCRKLRQLFAPTIIPVVMCTGALCAGSQCIVIVIVHSP